MDLTCMGYCGVDCAACPDLKREKCPGCRQTVWPENDPCPPVGCCRRQGIDCCGACPQFPCAMMAAFYEESESHRAARVRMETRRG